MIKKVDNFPLGVVFIVITMICFTILDSIAKYLIIHGIPAYQVAFTRYAVHTILATAVLYPIMKGKLFENQSGPLVYIRGILLAAMTGLNFWALQYISIATTAAILTMIPITICLLSIIVLKEKVGIHRWLSILMGFVGVIIIIRPFGVSFHWAMLLMLGMVLCAGLFTIITRKIAGVDSPYSLQFYSGIFGILFLLPFQFQGWVLPFDWFLLFLLFATGLMGWLGHQFLILAHHYAEASSLAPVGYIQFLFMGLSSWLIFNDVPDLPVFIGGGIVLISGLYILHRERKARTFSF